MKPSKNDALAPTSWRRVRNDRNAFFSLIPGPFGNKLPLPGKPFLCRSYNTSLGVISNSYGMMDSSRLSMIGAV
jgi:hypothetical protein